MKPPIKLALLVLAADLVAVRVIAQANQSSYLQPNDTANLDKSRQFEFMVEFEKQPQDPLLWFSPSSDKISKLTSNRTLKLSDSSKTQARFTRQAQDDKQQQQQQQQQNSPQIDQLRTATIPAANPNFEAAFQGECNRNNNTNNPCDHICLDLHDGTYECACFYGFTLAIDGYSCTRAANLQASSSASSSAPPQGKVASGKLQPKSSLEQHQKDVELRTRGEAIGPAWPVVLASDTETTTTAGHHRKLFDGVEPLQKQGRRRRRERNQETPVTTTATSQRRRKEQSARIYRQPETGKGNGRHHLSRLVQVAIPARRRTSKSTGSMALGDSSSNLVPDSQPDQVLGGQRKRPGAKKFTQMSKLAPRQEQEQQDEGEGEGEEEEEEGEGGGGGEEQQQRLVLRGTEEADAHWQPSSRRRNGLAKGRNSLVRSDSSHGDSESTTRQPGELDGDNDHNDEQDEQKEALLAVENQIDPQLWLEEERRLKYGLDEQAEENNDDKLAEELPNGGHYEDQDGADEGEKGEDPESDNLMTEQTAHSNNDLRLRTAALDEPRRGGAHVNPGGSSRQGGQDGSAARLVGGSLAQAHNDWRSRNDRQSSANLLSGPEHGEEELNNLVSSSAAIGRDDDDDDDDGDQVGDQDTRAKNQQADLEEEEEEARTHQLGTDLGLLENLVGKTMGDYYYRYAAAPGAQAGVGMNDGRRRPGKRLGQSRDVTALTFEQPATTIATTTTTTTRSPSAIKATRKASENKEEEDDDDDDDDDDE